MLRDGVPTRKDSLLTKRLDEMAAAISKKIEGDHATGELLALDPYQMGIQTAADYTRGLALLNSEETTALLEVFGGNVEMALRVLRSKIEPKVAQLLPAGPNGLTLRFDDWAASKELRLYTTPLYDSWYYSYRSS